MKIAKIVSSNSHIDYVARVIDSLDADDPPSAEDFGFAQFVSIPADADKIIGIIYDSKLINPEYANFGPRLSPKPELGHFCPDYLNEQGILIGILLIGSLSVDGVSSHEVPRRVVPAGQDVHTLDDELIRSFHTGGEGGLQLRYYSQVIAHAGQFAVPVLETVIRQLRRDCEAADAQRLSVLERSLAWQRTMGGNR